MSWDLFKEFSKEAYQLLLNTGRIIRQKICWKNWIEYFAARSNQSCKSPAHFIAEDIVAEKVKNELFRIFLEPLKVIHVASSEYDVGNSFTVHYPVAADGRELNEKSVRIYIAHELGHLYAHVRFSRFLC